MSLKSLLASATLGVFLASFCLAEAVPTAPGKSISADGVTPAVEEVVPLVLDSAPAEPMKFISMTDVQITPLADTAEVVFTTNIPTYATIEYGLTTELESAVTTEVMTAHIETLSGLTACHTYSYRVLATSADDAALDIGREGIFTTKGCVVKKSTPVVKKPVPASTPVVEPTVMNNEEWLMDNEEEMVLNAAPETIQNTSAAADKVQDESEGVAEDVFQFAPASPGTPMLISEPIEAPENRSTEAALALLGLLLLVVALIVVRRKR